MLEGGEKCKKVTEENLIYTVYTLYFQILHIRYTIIYIKYERYLLSRKNGVHGNE